MKKLINIFILFVTVVLNAQEHNQNDKALFTCGSIDYNTTSFKNVSSNSVNHSIVESSQLTSIRKLRIAIVATGEYSQYFINKFGAHDLSKSQQKTLVLKAIEASLFKINNIFRRDLMVEFELISDNEKLIFLNPDTDGLNAQSSAILITQLTEKINSIINVSDYDIAHGFSTTYGGLSMVGGVFGENKAQGVTGAPVPEGKIFDIDFFAHELGHQLGATHTQNSNCSRYSDSSVEAGSGSTIMSYAGVCDITESNVAISSLPYFHEYTISQINSNLNQFFNLKKKLVDLDLGKIIDYSIPLLTPFEIALNSKLPEPKGYYYSCNQVDADVTFFPPKSSSVSGPVFSAQGLSLNPVFCFPKLETVVNNNQFSKQGVLSNVPRTYNFLTSKRGGPENDKIVSLQKIKVNVVDAEPFQVTSQDEDNVNWFGGSNKFITWDVGGSKSKLGYENVAILLSDNNGVSFDYILSKKTPNDGNESVKVPENINSNSCRIKIKPLGAVFYSMNKKRFSISPLNYIEYSNVNSNKSNSINIQKEFKYDFLEVSVDLEAQNLLKTTINIVSPNGEEVILWNGECSNGTSLNVRFSDNEKNRLLEASAPGHVWVCDDVVLGLKIAKQNFSDLGNKAEGDWRLKIIDTSEDSQKVNLKSWKLHFYSKDKISENKTQNRDFPVVIYPNPIKSIMNIAISDPLYGSGKIEVFTISGSIKRTYQFHMLFQNQFNLNELETGIYILRLTSNNNVFSKKIVVN